MLHDSQIDCPDPLSLDAAEDPYPGTRNPLCLQSTSLDSLVIAAWEAVRTKAAQHNVFYRKHDLGIVLCDAELLQQVFLHLFANSIEYTRGLSPATVQVGMFTVEGEQVLFVRDNGTGFEKRYDDQGETGRDLASVIGIIHHHGGRVWANPGVDREATFYFTLRAPVTRKRTLPHRLAIG